MTAIQNPRQGMCFFCDRDINNRISIKTENLQRRVNETSTFFACKDELRAWFDLFNTDPISGREISYYKSKQGEQFVDSDQQRGQYIGGLKLIKRNVENDLLIPNLYARSNEIVNNRGEPTSKLDSLAKLMKASLELSSEAETILSRYLLYRKRKNSEGFQIIRALRSPDNNGEVIRQYGHFTILERLNSFFPPAMIDKLDSQSADERNNFYQGLSADEQMLLVHSYDSENEMDTDTDGEEQDNRRRVVNNPVRAQGMVFNPAPQPRRREDEEAIERRVLARQEEDRRIARRALARREAQGMVFNPTPAQLEAQRMVFNPVPAAQNNNNDQQRRPQGN